MQKKVQTEISATLNDDVVVHAEPSETITNILCEGFLDLFIAYKQGEIPAFGGECARLFAERDAREKKT